MIRISRKIDLGLDTTRMKDPQDAKRQTATAKELLRRLFARRSPTAWQIQLLADEVGMGKTFVALATAFSVLEHMQGTHMTGDLAKCYRKVLVITPQNSALFAKWNREVAEFVRRSVKEEHREQASSWFASMGIIRIDELAAELRRHTPGPQVLITNMGVLRGAKVRHYDMKRRFLLGTLFRYWGNRFRYDQRENLLKGAPEDWPRDPRLVDDFPECDLNRLLFNQEEVMKVLERLDRYEDSYVEKLLGLCRDIAVPFTRNRSDLFRKVKDRLNRLYHLISREIIRMAIPLVIVDEAHNWKNGPKHGTNGYDGFQDFIAPHTRRLLLLTATPFQLRPAEMLELMRIGEDIRPCRNLADSEARTEKLEHRRTEVIGPVLQHSTDASIRFERAWTRLSPQVTTEQLAEIWGSPPLEKARPKLYEIAVESGVVDTNQLERIIDTATRDLTPDVRELFREALRLYTYNSDLSQELGEFVIRHRRRTDHRLFRIGSEFSKPTSQVALRPDRHQLHPAVGLDVRGDGELPHYLLMRCVSEMKWAKHSQGRSSLGSELTGCYSTLLSSAEGRSITNSLADTPRGTLYLSLLQDLVGPDQDPHHPKVEQVVNDVLSTWESGEKALVFCFRRNTASRLRDIIDARVREALEQKKDRCLGGPEKLKYLRARLTARDQDLISIGLDRLLPTLPIIAATLNLPTPFPHSALALTDNDLTHLAQVALSHDVDLLVDRPDRVFLHRATEHIIAERLPALPSHSSFRSLIEAMADPSWITHPYGLDSTASTTTTDEGEESTSFDERGVHTVYKQLSQAHPDEVTHPAAELIKRREIARRQNQIPIIDSYTLGPNLWLGSDPSTTTLSPTLANLHSHLWALTMDRGELDLLSRLLAMQALRRALLRESVLLRLLPERSDREEARWADLLVRAFHTPLPNQRESMADKLSVFLEDLRGSSGSLYEPGSARHAIWDATLLRDQQFVALVSGDTNAQTRKRVFDGFNTPLLPEILVCTSVGQEGIDLHRHCRQVIHYDLAWNPAVMEQRTGRTDRIGSKVFREREVSTTHGPYLEIGVPFLAGTYDERMYEEVRVRAQVFEVLTGGSLNRDQVEGEDLKKGTEGISMNMEITSLPPTMVQDLRVALHVFG